MTAKASMPRAQWPDQDRRLWDNQTASGDPFDDNGPLSHLRPATLGMLEMSYGRWLSWLSRTAPEILDLDPAARPTIGRLRDWIRDLERVSPVSRHLFVNHILRVITAARPDHDWSQQRRLVLQLERLASDHRSARKDGRIVSRTTLLACALNLAGPKADAALSEVGRMKRRRDGALMAFLALIPLRRRAMAGLELERSLLVTDAGMLVCVPGEMSKSGVPWQTEVPDQLLPLMRRYLVEVRPWMMNRHSQSHSMLWVTDKGGPLGSDYLAAKIRRVTERELGIPLSPHLFRDAAATSLSRASPESARLIRPLLAHSSHETAERHYNHARTIDAARGYAKLVESIRNGD